MGPDLNTENMSFMKKGTYILKVPFWSSYLFCKTSKTWSPVWQDWDKLGSVLSGERMEEERGLWT